jgi:outer membrane protein TolC
MSTIKPTLENLQQATPTLPEVKRAEASQRAAHFQTELARKQGAPEIGLELYRSNLFRRVPEQGIQLTFTWTPWDYGQIAAEIATREGEEKAREAEIEQVRRQMAQRLEGSYHAWKGAQRRRDLLHEQVLESLRLAKVAQRGFEAGYWTLQDTLDAQRSFRDSQLEYLNAESEYALMWLELTWLTNKTGDETPELSPTKASEPQNELRVP